MIGRGGMGAVYKARQSSLDGVVAVKVLPVLKDDLGMGFVDRFRNEARMMARMNHPGIVHVHDFGTLKGGMCYFVMEHVEGTDVADGEGERTPPAGAGGEHHDGCLYRSGLRA